MKSQKITDLDDQELRTQLKDLQEQTFRLKFQMAMGQMDGLKKLRETRKSIARVHTALRQRELSAKG